MKKLEFLYITIIVLLLTITGLSVWIYNINTSLLQSNLREIEQSKKREEELRVYKVKIDSLQKKNRKAIEDLKKMDILIERGRSRIDSLKSNTIFYKYESASVREIIEYWESELSHIDSTDIN